MKRRFRTGSCLAGWVLVVLTICSGTEILAYESQPVVEGSTVRGTVTFIGTVPPPKEFELHRSLDHEYCTQRSDLNGYRLMREITVRADGGLKDVLVMVEGVERGKPFPFTDVEVEARGCRFMPFVTVVGDKRLITVFNRDSIPHDIQGYAFDQTGGDMVFYRPSLEANGTTDTVQLVKGRKVFSMQCSMHPYMQSWGYAIDHPYFSVTDAAGSFSIDDLPPGKYRLKVWHPVLGTREQALTVTANETISLNLWFEAKD
ncbi:MAG: hypothetical protein JSR31_02790 [Nitrospira sp.]|nr:hypothetical protein [Nitrospira sp.]